MPILFSLLFIASAYVFKRQKKLERQVTHYLNLIEEDMEDHEEKLNILAASLGEFAEIKNECIMESIEKEKKVFEFIPKKKIKNEIN